MTVSPRPGLMFLLLFLPVILSFGICPAAKSAVPPAQDVFPIYPEIKPNVDFWVDIFTRYSKTEGVVHHTWDLSKVFAVISLDPTRTRSAAKNNRRTVKQAVKTWKTALIKASQGSLTDPEKQKKIETLFGKTPDAKTLKNAAYSLRVQTGLKEHFREGLIRSGAMVPEFKKIFRHHGVPEDLVFLPCVESSFNVYAYSKFGAAGVWQFTRGTGKRYMEIGYVVDERRDPFIASQAAARLLKRNYGALGDWSLAITAYNHGLNGMKRALKRHGNYPAIYKNYRSRSFKFASRNFYSEFLAARQVAKNHLTYFGEIRKDRPVAHTRITTQGFLSVADMAQKLDLDLATIRQMNPALRPPVFDGRKFIPKGFSLRLPGPISPAVAVKAVADLYRDKQKPSRFHRVQRGDTAGKIAMIHDVRLKDLILANGLNRRATIYVGQSLRIPSARETLVAAAAPARTNKNTLPVKTAKDNMTAKAAKETLPAPPEPAIPLDTKIFEPAVEPPPAAPNAPAVLTVVTADLKIARQTTDKNKNTGIIHVAPEETLGHYADWLGIATQKIRTLNRLSFGTPISVGQEIKIPLAKDSSAAFEEKRYEFHQEILEDFFGSFFVTDTDTYEIKAGDTLWDLCLNTLEIPLWLLEKYNPGITRHTLNLGDKINYPLVSPRNGKTEGIKFTPPLQNSGGHDTG
jgi:membrane-bound lytic murein transglycosylase D